MNDKEKIIKLIYDKIDYHWDKLSNNWYNVQNHINTNIISCLFMILIEIDGNEGIMSIWEYIVKKLFLPKREEKQNENNN